MNRSITETELITTAGASSRLSVWAKLRAAVRPNEATAIEEQAHPLADGRLSAMMTAWR